MSDTENTRSERGEDGRFLPGNQRRFSNGNKAATHKRNGYHLKPLLKRILAEIVAEDKEKRTAAELFVRMELQRAIKKGGDSAKRIWEYVEGKPEQPGDENRPLNVKVSEVASALKKLADGDSD